MSGSAPRSSSVAPEKSLENVVSSARNGRWTLNEHAEYEMLRSEAHQFAIRPGHDERDVERVIASKNGYDIVEKFRGAPERIAEETDPRA